MISSKYPISVFNERVWLLARVTPRISALKAELIASLLFAFVPILIFYLIQVAANKRSLEVQLEAASLREKLLERDAQLAKLSSQVAHDIRSPISVLNLVVSSLREIPEDRLELINKAVGRINEIANDLLFRPASLNVDSANDGSPLREESSVEELVDALLKEKAVEFRGAKNVSFSASMNREKSTFSSLPTPKLSRIVSNLVNNAVESLEGRNGHIELSLDSAPNSGAVVLAIVDNGVGIPAEKLAEINRREFSSSKSSGSGLGLKDAFETLDKVGGEIEIGSVKGEGTRVKLTIPLRATQ